MPLAHFLNLADFALPQLKCSRISCRNNGGRMIICLGPTPALARTMTFEKIVVDEVNRALRVHHFAAGKATNVARVLHTLGYPALVTGFLGGDTARIFQNDL